MNFKTTVTKTAVNVQSSMKIVKNFTSFPYLSSRLTPKELNKSIYMLKNNNNKSLNSLLFKR